MLALGGLPDSLPTHRFDEFFEAAETLPDGDGQERTDGQAHESAER